MFFLVGRKVYLAHSFRIHLIINSAFVRRTSDTSRSALEASRPEYSPDARCSHNAHHGPSVLGLQSSNQEGVAPPPHQSISKLLNYKMLAYRIWWGGDQALGEEESLLLCPFFPLSLSCALSCASLPTPQATPPIGPALFFLPMLSSVSVVVIVYISMMVCM